jgi:hypothetical protein
MEITTSTQLDTHYPCTEIIESAQPIATVPALAEWVSEVSRRVDQPTPPEAPHLWSEIFSMQLVS